jgi:hypothetical protein
VACDSRFQQYMDPAIQIWIEYGGIDLVLKIGKDWRRPRKSGQPWAYKHHCTGLSCMLKSVIWVEVSIEALIQGERWWRTTRTAWTNWYGGHNHRLGANLEGPSRLIGSKQQQNLRLNKSLVVWWVDRYGAGVVRHLNDAGSNTSMNQEAWTGRKIIEISNESVFEWVVACHCYLVADGSNFGEMRAADLTIW